MSTRPSFTTRTLRRSFIGTLAVLAMVPLLYFSACSSGGDNGGGGGGGTNSPPPTGAANQFAYVISANSEIQANSLDGNGSLTKIGGIIPTGLLPHHVDVDRAGRFVYVSNHESSFVSGWRINQDGSLDPMTPGVTGSPVTTDANPHSSVIDQTGEYLYVVSGTGASTLRAYKIDTTSGPTRGIPTPITGTSSFPVGTHGHNVAISPNNLFLYVASEGTPLTPTGEVFAFSRDTATGALTPRGSLTGMDTADAVVVSNDNRFVYVAYSNAVDLFSVDQSTGALTRAGTFSTNNAGQGSGPHSMALHPNGQTLYTANINANTVSVFRVDTNTGALTELQIPPPATGIGPNFVAIHPNGAFLFTADANADQLTRFAINADGTLATPGTAIPAADGTNGIGTTKF